MNRQMNFEELQKSADAAMHEALTSAGFRCVAPGTWNRHRGDEINVVQLQKQSAAESFCVNLGVHFAFLPKAGVEAPLDDDEIKLPDCELKLRLTEQIADKDQWWPISEASAQLIADLVQGRGLPAFESYRTEGELAAMSAKSIESGSPGLLAPITKVRACLLLARLHERLGNRDKCIEAATIGVKLAGMAVGPKKALKDILKRCEQPT
jgi:Domain of unknown function (DUF4304)